MGNDEPQYLYLTTTGWKTGHPHEIEIWFVWHEGCSYVVSEQWGRAHWVQNLRRSPAVTFRVDGQAFQGMARIIERASEPALATAVAAQMDAKYGWSNGLIVELKPG